MAQAPVANNMNNVNADAAAATAADVEADAAAAAAAAAAEEEKLAEEKETAADTAEVADWRQRELSRGEVEMLKGSCHCGAVRWQFEGQPEGATACNCTVCRRYGVLWAYDYEGEGIKVSGNTQKYIRGRAIEFHFCPVCACIAFWRSRRIGEDGRCRIAVNLRLAEQPEAVGHIPIDHFDGLDTFDDLPRDGRCVADYWF
jgi:hypothetical protein